MPTIKFTATPKLPNDYKHLGYVKGMEITDRQGWCDKWVNRGVAVFVDEAPVAVAVVVPEPVAEPVVNVAPDIVQADAEAATVVVDATAPDVVADAGPAVVPEPVSDKPRRGRPRAS